MMFGLMLLESLGLPVPGETALIACSVLAPQGALQIEWVITVAILAAIIGDNLGYWVARKGGRRLLYHTKLTRRYAEHYLPRGERFFAKHGGKAVFFGRFVAVLRVTAAWTAGLSHMHWWRFFFWNALGAIVWATMVGLVSYYLGDAAASAIGRYGLYAAGGAILLTALGYLIVRRPSAEWSKRNSPSSESRRSHTPPPLRFTRLRVGVWRSCASTDVSG